MAKNVYQRIHAVMVDIDYLAKDDFVETGKGKGYRAVTEEKVTSAVRASLVKHGLVVIPIGIDRECTNEEVVDKYGNRKINHFVQADTKYRIQNIDDPEDYVIAVSSGSGVDTQDKGVGKALTYAYKYLFLRTFAVPTGEDPDKTTSAKTDKEFTPAGNTITEKEYGLLLEACTMRGKDEAWLHEFCGVKRGADITHKQRAEVIIYLGKED